MAPHHLMAPQHYIINTILVTLLQDSIPFSYLIIYGTSPFDGTTTLYNQYYSCHPATRFNKKFTAPHN